MRLLLFLNRKTEKPENQRLAIARRATEVKERRAIFAANARANAGTPSNSP
jgi:hypothetical protein